MNHKKPIRWICEDGTVWWRSLYCSTTLPNGKRRQWTYWMSREQGTVFDVLPSILPEDLRGAIVIMQTPIHHNKLRVDPESLVCEDVTYG
jgi:hypothetical protein